ncbi:MAG: exodeoxyribonuclease VII large subunit [Spirochaetes bacterium]|nr:exodeoxyribonuclease VII large subunit [Spirochaetota bacterium]
MIEEIENHETVYSVSDITGILKRLIESTPELNGVWVKGEISNLTYHSSGHIYFSLKDEQAVIQSVFFKHANKNLDFRLEEGMSVVAFGGVTVFEKRGSYQFIVYRIRKEGIGELLQRIEKLKEKLYKEGLFSPERKKPLPALPRRIGVVTSPTGAAIRDIIKVAMRRFPNIEIVIAPVKVQGEGAVESIVTGIRELNKPEWGVDVIIAGRGGGSFEDLMAFNEEAVVRAFASSRVPIISAVGHQIDHPLSDLASDVAAPTPSAAAEIAVPVKDDLLATINNSTQRMLRRLFMMVQTFNNRIALVTRRRVFQNPLSMVENYELALADTQNRMLAAMHKHIAGARERLSSLKDLQLIMKNRLQNYWHIFMMQASKVEHLSPVNVLKRGYSITMKDNRVISSITNVHRGDSVHVIVYDGSLECEIQSVRTEVGFGKKG